MRLSVFQQMEMLHFIVSEACLRLVEAFVYSYSYLIVSALLVVWSSWNMKGFHSPTAVTANCKHTQSLTKIYISCFN